MAMQKSMKCGVVRPPHLPLVGIRAPGTASQQLRASKVGPNLAISVAQISQRLLASSAVMSAPDGSASVRAISSNELSIFIMYLQAL